MKNTIKKFLLCFSILGMLVTSLPSSSIDVMVKEVQQSQVAQEVEESSIEVNTTPLETPTENIGGGLQYVEQIEVTNLTRGSPRSVILNIARHLDFGTGEYLHSFGL